MVTHTSCLSSLCLNLWSFILHINELGHGKEVKTQDNSYEDLWSSLLRTPPPHPHPLPALALEGYGPLGDALRSSRGPKGRGADFWDVSVGKGCSQSGFSQLPWGREAGMLPRPQIREEEHERR